MNPISSNPQHTVQRSPLTSIEAAHAPRGQHWLNSERLRIYSLVALVCYGVFLLIYLYRTEWQHRPDFGPLALDFLPFWSASFLALHHHAIDAYNVVALTAVETDAIARDPGVLVGAERQQVDAEHLRQLDEEGRGERPAVGLDEVQVRGRDPQALRQLNLAQALATPQRADLGPEARRLTT